MTLSLQPGASAAGQCISVLADLVLVVPMIVPTQLPGERLGGPGGRVSGSPRAAGSGGSRSAPRWRALSHPGVTLAGASAPQADRKPPVPGRGTPAWRRAGAEALCVG